MLDESRERPCNFIMAKPSAMMITLATDSWLHLIVTQVLGGGPSSWACRHAPILRLSMGCVKGGEAGAVPFPGR